MLSPILEELSRELTEHEDIQLNRFLQVHMLMQSP